jgi:hypothetical protein
MKNTLAENMLRFGVKNLNELNKDSLKALTEQKPNTPVAATGQLETLNLYQDKANNTPWNTGMIVEPKIIDKIKFSNGTCTIKIQLRGAGNTTYLVWDSKRPNEFTYMPNATSTSGEKIVYNQNLSDKLRALHKKTVYNKNATYAQTNTPETGDDQSVA